jgi:hypothetical protein
MHPMLAEILRSREVRTINSQLLQLHSNIEEAEGKFIQDVISDVKPKCSIEIGCAYGGFEPVHLRGIGDFQALIAMLKRGYASPRASE